MQSYGNARPGLMKLVAGLPSGLLLEVLIRIAMAIVFGLLQHVPPRARDIHPEELWLYRNKPSAPYFPSWWVVVMVTIAVPALLLSLLQFQQQKQPQDLSDSSAPLGGGGGGTNRQLSAFQLTLLGYSLSVLLTGLLTDTVKLTVGRPRPDFFYRCLPSGDPDAIVPDDGDSPVQQQPPLSSLILIPSACIGDPDIVAEGRKSFPSGHASMSFASLTYLALQLADWLLLCGRSNGVNAAAPAAAWRLLVCLAPCLAASGIALSRLVDYHHHAEDVLAGSALGFLVAAACHRCYRRFGGPPAGWTGGGRLDQRINV